MLAELFETLRDSARSRACKIDGLKHMDADMKAHPGENSADSLSVPYPSD